MWKVSWSPVSASIVQATRPFAPISGPNMFLVAKSVSNSPELPALEFESLGRRQRCDAEMTSLNTVANARGGRIIMGIEIHSREVPGDPGDASRLS
jgi:hypothetical protein